MFYENVGTEKSLTYFCPEQILRGAKIRKSFSMGIVFFYYLFYWLDEKNICVRIGKGD